MDVILPGGGLSMAQRCLGVMAGISGVTGQEAFISLSNEEKCIASLETVHNNSKPNICEPAFSYFGFSRFPGMSGQPFRKQNIISLMLDH
jgi:hypothetical protein